MKAPSKDRWKATASSGDPRLAIDDRYATTWKSKPAKKSWLKIDLGKAATLAGLEVYWGPDLPVAYGFKSSLDGKRWTHLCRTRHGEGGQDVFAFPPVEARFVRWTCDDPQAERGKEIVEINLYGSARRGVGDGKGAGRRARLRAGEASQRREHHGRLRLCALSARRVHRVGRGLWNRLLGLPLRRRRELSRGRAHPDRQWRQRQLLVALDHEPLFSLDRPRDEHAGRRDRQRAQAAHPEQGSHADRPARTRGGGRARRPLSAVAARPPGLLDRARRV